MGKYIYAATIFLALFLVGCDNADELLEQYTKNGPIVYAGKINELNSQSGYNRVKVNIYPAEDVNRAYCVLSWSITSGVKDSVKVNYMPGNYDKELSCYYTIINLPNVEGNVVIESQNVDTFGNRSLKESKSAYVYGSDYVSTLLNSSVTFSAKVDQVIFENRVGSVGNLISYQQTNGEFTPEVFVTGAHPLINPKKGGIVRSKTRYLLTATDIDTLMTTAYLETVIP
jgi:hypothetical protein